MRKPWCVIPAAGSGRRFGGDVPKQYALLMGRPVLAWTLARLASHGGIAGLVVVLARDDARFADVPRPDGLPVRTAIGGAERADSVLAGLQALPEDVGDDDPVLVHDAARPCVRHEDLTRLIAAATADDVGALLAARVRDTLKAVENGRATATLPRENLWRAMTPQAFRRGALTQALSSTKRENGSGASAPTDEAKALEVLGKSAAVVEGYDDNLKITSAADLALAEWILRTQGER